MQPPDPMSDLAHAIATLAASVAPEDARIGEALAAWRRSRNATLEEAAGWASNVRACSMQRARDAALRRLMQRFPDKTGRGLARAVYQVLRRCEASAAWQHGRRPDGEIGDAFDALSNGGPLCEGYLRSVLIRLAD